MNLHLYLKEENQFRFLEVPSYVVKDLLRDRLSSSELARIDRFAEKVDTPDVFKAGSVVVDFSKKTAECFQAGLNIPSLEPTWDVRIERMKLENY